MTARDEIHAFVDGEMSPDEAVRFRERLAESAALQEALESVMALDAVASVSGEAYGEVVPLPGGEASEASEGVRPRHLDHPGCVSTDSLERYVRKQLGEQDRRAVEAHLPCPRCDPELRLLTALVDHERRSAGAFARWWSSLLSSVEQAPRTWMAGAATTAVGIVAVVVASSMIAPPREASLRARIVAQSPVMRGQIAYAGDVLVAEAVAGSPGHAELRVYAEEEGLVLRCPGDGRCTVGEEATSVRLKLDTPGVYHVLLITSERPLPPPLGSFEADVAALPRAVLQSERFVVRPRE